MSLFLTFVPEGTCVTTKLWGKSKPQFILAYKGHHLDRYNNIVRTADWADDDPRWEAWGIQLPSLADEALEQAGLYPVGLPPRKVVSWEQTWSEWSHVDENGKRLEHRRLWVRKEPTTRFMVMNFSYAFRMKELETTLGIKINVDFTVFVEGTNPETALVRHDDWYNRFEGLVRDRAKNFFGAKNLFELMSEEKKAGALQKILHPFQTIVAERQAAAAARHEPAEAVEEIGTFNAYMVDTKMLVDTVLTPLAQALGVKITGVAIEDFGLAGSEAELQKAMSSTTRQAIANANVRSLAEARKDAAVSEGEGEAAAMNLITAARATRAEVDLKYITTPGGVALAVAEARADAEVKIASLEAGATTALAGNTTLKTLALGGSAKPVVPIGNDQAA